MTGRTIEASPQVYARMAGVFHLLEAFTATLGGHILFPGFVVSGGAVMASNFLENEPLFWWGFANMSIGILFHIAWFLLFYYLLKPVNRNVSLLAAFVMLVGCACQALTGLFYASSVRVLTDGGAFTTEQLQALAFLFNIYLVFFGCWCVLTGYLIFRSTFLPRALGLLLVVEGLCWMTFLSPTFGRTVLPVTFITIVLAELPLMLWLLVRGVDVRKWQEKASVLQSS